MPGSVRVSVVIPVHNVADYLEQCVASALGQDHPDLDIILVDDGSTDGSGALCDAIALQENRIRVIHQANNGLSAARNVGLSVADGDLVTFLDSDDWWEPTFVGTLVEAILRHPTAGIAASSFARVPGVASMTPTTTTRLYSPDEAIRLFAGPHHTLLTIACAKLFRRSLLTDVAFPDGRLHEDEFTTYRLLLKAPTVLVPQPLYLYRQRSTGIVSSPLTPERLRDAVDAADQQSADLLRHGHVAAAAWAEDQALRKRIRLIRLLSRSGRRAEARLEEGALADSVRTGTKLPRPRVMRVVRRVAAVSPRLAVASFEAVTRSRSVIRGIGGLRRART